MKEFAVKSENWNLYLAFISELKERGYQHNDIYGKIDNITDACYYHLVVNNHKKEYFFSSSVNVEYLLENKWKEAIDSLCFKKDNYSKTNVTLKEIAEWKGVSVNDITISYD